MNVRIKNILVCDDDSEIRDLVKDALQSYDRSFHIVEAVNGSDALAKCEFQRFDLIILDMRMPRKTGMEVIEALEKMPTKKKPRAVLVVSGNSDFKALENRDTQYLYFPKPFSTKELITAVIALTQPPASSGDAAA
ncbi:MAG: response regulator [Bdellovibrionales bacterium]|nr:response regulator [Bdellovibrionales bacterium]